MKVQLIWRQYLMLESRTIAGIKSSKSKLIEFLSKLNNKGNIRPGRSSKLVRDDKLDRATYERSSRKKKLLIRAP